MEFDPSHGGAAEISVVEDAVTCQAGGHNAVELETGEVGAVAHVGSEEHCRCRYVPVSSRACGASRPLSAWRSARSLSARETLRSGLVPANRRVSPDAFDQWLGANGNVVQRSEAASGDFVTVSRTRCDRRVPLVRPEEVEVDRRNLERSKEVLAFCLLLGGSTLDEHGQ